MKIRVTSTGTSDFNENLSRSRLWNRYFTEFARLLPFNELERFHGCLPSVPDLVDVDEHV